jgi:tRNA (guanine37-N1)-methyltransferase
MSGTPRSIGRYTISASNAPRDLMDGPRRVKGAWTARVVTLFPDAFPGTLGLSLTGKALEMGLWALETIDCAASARGGTATWTTRPRAAGPGWSCAPTWSRGR